jgi:hypothetical protein
MELRPSHRRIVASQRDFVVALPRALVIGVVEVAPHVRQRVLPGHGRAARRDDLREVALEVLGKLLAEPARISPQQQGRGTRTESRRTVSALD